MRKLSVLLALVAGLFTAPAYAANFSAKDAAAATIIFTNPGNCTTGCTPIFAWSDSSGANLVAVLTAGADGASNTANGGLTYGRNLVFNGTTWDRWTGAVTIAGVATAANQTSQITQETATAAALGTTTDAVAATPSTGSAATLIALAKAINNNVSAAVPAGTNLIGDVNVRQGGTALSATNPLFSTDIPSSAAGAGIAPVVSAATEGTHVLKASAGNLYGLTTTIGVTSGYIMVFNATSAPADGAVTPIFCRYIKSDATAGSNSVEFKPPLALTTGVSVAFSTTGCFTKTVSATAFFSGQVQ